MAVSAVFYAPVLAAAFNKELDFNSDTLKAMLLTSSYTPDTVAHDYKNDLTNEVSGTGYTAGGATLTTATIGIIAANSWGTSRANSTAYAANQIVKPASGNGFLYMASAAGTTGGSVPTYPTVIGGTVTDGGVTWICIGRALLKLDADDVSWAASTITGARYIVIYDSSPATDATRPLIALGDFGGDVSTVNGTLSVAWAADGIALIPIA